VLTAFENVADTLHAFEQDADAVSRDDRERDAAKVTLDLKTRQMQVGYVSYLTPLSAEQDQLF
jgi:outer membrane protein TolC